ncbi:HpcH/HpaI aldolase family protein [Maliponia aquimaris]|uniref:5-keto-4-deoxy-D-glucarate aldolase n=1 Tax=Maliponia aquimaris TaxID=1673631 RepID=A0A238KE66_9RHOB|nr:aldolase/citrate lyase family protein [Maliponia aquimaris]SMX41108.1 5-keto-4-deoxy-D-glucarate aldolase [Maliponia aquimaris]
MHNRLKALWAAGKPAMNGWCSIGNPFTAEIMAAQGYDSLSVDWQHGALDYSDVLPMLQAMRASGVTPMVRVPWLDPASVMKALDAGALGIICPMISTAAQAAEFVSYMRYPPLGQRSFGPTRAGFAMPGYGVAMNAEVLALAMIETKEGVENLEEIAATPGLDGIYVGPADLTLGTQDGRLPPGFDREEPEMVALIRRIAEVCKTNGIRACLHCGTPEYAAKAIGWGYDLTTVGGDTRLLAAAAKASVERFRQLTEGPASAGTEGGY